jgi:hypothetical protein
MEAEVLNEFVVSHINLDEVYSLVLFNWACDVVLSVLPIY